MTRLARTALLAGTIVVTGCYSAQLPMSDDGGPRDGGDDTVLVTYQLDLGQTDWSESTVMVDDAAVVLVQDVVERYSYQRRMPASANNAYPSVPIGLRIHEARTDVLLFESEIRSVYTCPIPAGGQRVSEFGFGQILKYPLDDVLERIPGAPPELVTTCGFCQLSNPEQRVGWCF